MSEYTHNNCYFPAAKAFMAAINGFFDCTQPAIAGELTRRINDSFQVNWVCFYKKILPNKSGGFMALFFLVIILWVRL